jgi:hypothetical protein
MMVMKMKSFVSLLLLPTFVQSQTEAPSMADSMSETDTWAPTETFDSSVCACQPSAYEVFFRSSQSCSDTTLIAGSPGVESVTCRVVDSTGVDVVGDAATPVGNFTDVVYYELGQDGMRINEIVDDLNYEENGPPAYIDSLVLFEPDLLDSTYIPKAIGMEVTSTNANGDIIRNILEVVFTNDCAIPSVMTNGVQLGWLQMNVSL